MGQNETLSALREVTIPEIPTSAELSDRLAAVAGRFCVARYVGPGNPFRAESAERNGAVATKVSWAPNVSAMNTVHGLVSSDDVSFFADFFAETSQPMWVDVRPGDDTKSLTSLLIRDGFNPRFHISVLVGRPIAVALPNESIQIDSVTSSNLDTFLDVLNVGFKTRRDQLPAFREIQRFWLDREGWRLFLARVDGDPAGAAILSVDDQDVHSRIGYLASAATLPEFEGRGVHRALIARRIGEANDMGCLFVTGQALFGSTSQRNQQREGLQIAHVATSWSDIRDQR